MKVKRLGQEVRDVKRIIAEAVIGRTGYEVVLNDMTLRKRI